jgi:hypothetical protein
MRASPEQDMMTTPGDKARGCALLASCDFASPIDEDILTGRKNLFRVLNPIHLRTFDGRAAMLRAMSRLALKASDEALTSHPGRGCLRDLGRRSTKVYLRARSAALAQSPGVYPKKTC